MAFIISCIGGSGGGSSSDSTVNNPISNPTTPTPEIPISGYNSNVQYLEAECYINLEGTGNEYVCAKEAGGTLYDAESLFITINGRYNYQDFDVVKVNIYQDGRLATTLTDKVDTIYNYRISYTTNSGTYTGEFSIEIFIRDWDIPIGDVELEIITHHISGTQEKTVLSTRKVDSIRPQIDFTPPSIEGDWDIVFNPVTPLLGSTAIVSLTMHDIDNNLDIWSGTIRGVIELEAGDVWAPGIISIRAEFKGDNFLYGEMDTATYQVPVLITSNTVTGNWHIKSLMMEDKYGNRYYGELPFNYLTVMIVH